LRKIILPPVVLALCLIALIAINYFDVAGDNLLSGRVKSAGYFLMIIGIALPIWGARLFRQHKTNILPYNDPDNIVTKGPFSFSRNPMYLGMLLVLLGAAIRFGTGSGFIFPVIYFGVANWYFIPFEEGRMAIAFGDEFTAYKAKVRRWL
jgi:protein-S-isoprenylcysteine O-methyltransferase Ste14